MKIDDFVTYVHRKEDKVYLRTKLLPVSIRLFHSSPQYKHIVLQICRYIEFLALSKPDDYKLPHGMSGANTAIPFNIIGYVKDRDKSTATCIIMINPEIVFDNDELIETESNCGSIRLEKPIKIKRLAKIKVNYFDETGTEHCEWFDRNNGSFTIQHEIDHNNGVLITDY